jgi:hypothetical protein
MVAVPVTTVHAPVPLVGVLPARVAVAAHTVWSAPALDAVSPPLTVMITSSVDEVQPALAIVHLKVFAPTPNPVNPEVGLDGVVIVAVPDIKVQVPVPVVAVLPARVAVDAHTVWSGPALDVVGVADLVMTTSSVDAVHPAPLIVHLKVFAPTPKPVTPDIALVGVVMVAVPVTTVHAPVPLVGVLPARVAVAAHTVWSAPALEAVSPPLTLMITSSVEDVQGELLIVHLKVLAPTPNPVTPEVALDGVVIVAVPETTVQVPVPLVAVLPAKVVLVAHMV